MVEQQRINWVFPLLLVLYEISTYLSNDMYLPALPDMMQNLNISATSAQLTVAMWFLGAAITPLMMGALADRFGRRPTLLIGGAIYVIATGMCALSTNEYTLLVSRVLQGAMVSSMMVAGYASIHELYEHKTAIRILAIMGAISVLAPAFGPLLGAVVLLFASWRMIFWFIAIFSTITLICLYRRMPETLLPTERQSLNPGTLLKSYWRVLISRHFLLLMGILGFTFAGFISWITAGPLLVIHSLKYSVMAFGWMQAAVFFAYIFGSHVVNWLTEKHSAHRLVKVGLYISLVAGILMSLFSYYLPDQFILYLITIILYSFGSALIYAPLNRLIIETSDQPMGIRVAVFTVGLMGCGVLGSGIASYVYNGTTLSLGSIITVGVVVAFALQYFNQGE